MPKPGSTHARGYGRAHEQQRRAWAPRVARGEVNCAKCGQLIPPRSEWDLGHTDDRTAWTGPEHPACNRSAGGKAGRAKQLGTDGHLRHSRAW